MQTSKENITFQHHIANATSEASNSKCHNAYVTFQTSHCILHIAHITFQTSQAKCHISSITWHTSHWKYQTANIKLHTARLQINQTRCTILLNIFISLLYMFRATMCPSSGEITVSMRMRHWYLSLCMGGVWSAGWSFSPTSRPDATHTEWKILVSHRYSNFSWWWAHGCPKHVEKRNKYTKQNCAPSWIYLQDCKRMQVNKTRKMQTSHSKHHTAYITLESVRLLSPPFHYHTLTENCFN